MSQRTKQPAAIWRGMAALGMIGALVGCSGLDTGSTSPDTDSTTAGPSQRAERTAEKVVQVSEVHPETGMTLIEGPTFGPDGGLFVVDVTAPPGDPKVLKVDVDGQTVEGIYTNETSAFTSAQFSPQDGLLYLTDFVGGKIESITAEGTDPKTFFSGDVEGTSTKLDDLAFDEAGHLFVSDTTGHDGPASEVQGRIVRIDKDTAQPTVLARDLPAPNGISFTEDFKALWVSQYSENRIDYLGLSEDKTRVETSHPGVQVNGGKSQIDSNAVDESGNIYQAFHGQPSIYVYSPQGELLSTVSVPADDAEGLTSATNVAIKPGTSEAYMTVSGPDGGFVYSFEALGTGIRQSNGG
ncbi:SMP-30/gluconolactonase/LRE family protein [Arthrobacter sp. zg-Y820]|uniref:SMP-30/gluconolactonase/LRE family protein n=1 Tax=unclassified Arthrobacter TaxID=235627 RepID=UPI001E306AD9|nr:MULTISPECIES: SMP-30/gluconolactonase/LRE family protein [unclassified Arthrobacter]MCC9197078.1 SMP-30/gluconolactonase/LRE family protein [Arthrobacter sp. zg-Y820]MDK1279943.1 SMP-30/gluconolactonase/LRE family protein [Arthrobacter sp. zg.Y820]WIB09242.1 SMP-30/gluconolactonase/LRE family protein [Arthrobacter sp. zg-Y820]